MDFVTLDQKPDRRPGHTTAIMTAPPAWLPPNSVLHDERRRRRGLTWFLGLTFGLSWALMVAARLVGASLADPVIQLVTVAFIPALSAVVVRAWITREGFADAGLRLRLGATWRYYLLAALLPLAFLATAALLVVCAGLVPAADVLELARGNLLFLLLAPLLVVIATPLYWGEEFCWTSYLRTHLLPGRPIASTLLTGVIWGVWHWPLPFVGYFGATDLGGPWRIAGQLVLWVVLCVLLEIILSWSYWTTGSIWVTSILHAGNNLVLSAGIGVVLTGWDINAVTAVICLGTLPMCVWILARRYLASHTEGHQ